MGQSSGIQFLTGRRPSEVPSCSFKAASALCGRKGWPGLSAPRNGHVRKSVPQRQRWRLIVQCVVRTLHSSRKSEQGLLLDGEAVCQDPGLWLGCVSAFPSCFTVNISSGGRRVRDTSEWVSEVFTEGIDACVVVYPMHPILGRGRCRNLLFCLPVDVPPRFSSKTQNLPKIIALRFQRKFH